MKGWVLCENNKPVGKIFYSGSIIIFKTKADLFDYYEGALGDNDSIRRVEYAIGIKQRKK